VTTQRSPSSQRPGPTWSTSMTPMRSAMFEQ
jgi:hypothetical protein